MPVHVTFAQHVKNAAFAALFYAKAKIKGDNRMAYSARELNESQLRRSLEEERRQSSAKNVIDYRVALSKFANETPAAIDGANLTELISSSKLGLVEIFFSMNAENHSTPNVYFIRHKKRNELKRVELCLCDPGTGQAEVIAELWTDV
jgi:hypothetical protein